MKNYHPDNPMLIANWFDPHNEEHLRALRESEELGYLPEWFKDKVKEAGVEYHKAWWSVVESKLAAAWITLKLGKDSDV